VTQNGASQPGIPGKVSVASRVAVAGNWLDDQTQGDPVVISPPVEVTTT